MHRRHHRAAGRFLEILICLVVTVLATSSRAAAQQFIDDTASRFPVPNPSDYTNQLTIGDIDGDGDLDIVFANGGGFSTPGSAEIQRVYINNGTGVFTDQSAARLGYSAICRGVEMGDIDGDGDLDLIFTLDFNRRPTLFLNDGNGFFTNVTSQRLPPISMSSSRAQFADIDNDGDLDLFFVNGGTSRFGCGQYRVFVNNGLGFFTDETATRFPIGLVCEPMDAIFGDIDGDFDLDLRTASRGNNNSKLYRNNGNGVYTVIAGVPPDSNCYSYDFGDLNGNGHLDLLGVNAGPNNTELLLQNDGTGNYTNISSQLLSNPTTDDNDSKFFDYDNDGDLDIIIGTIGSASERILNNNGAGVFSPVTNLITPVTDSTMDIMVADLTNNGRLDIVTGLGESGSPFQHRIYIYLGTADTIPPRIVAIEQLPDTDDTIGPYVVRAAILDGMTSDRNFFDKGVFLNYALGDGDFERVPMRYSGGQIYRGVIPGQPCGGTLTYYVTAKDWAENVGEGEPRDFHISDSGPLRFVFNGGAGAPSLAAPCIAHAFELDIQPCTESYQPGTAILHYQFDEEGSSIPLTSLGGSLHIGTLPAARCGTTASYFISAQTLSGQTVYYPPNGPTSPMVLEIGVLAPQAIFAEDFEGGAVPTGWQAQALWTVTDECILTPVCNGASWAYFGVPDQCDYDAGFNDGLLSSPPIALPQSGSITLQYCSTFERENFGATDWPSVLLNGQIIDEPAAGGVASTPWQTRTIDLTAYAGQVVNLAWRFNTIDQFGNAFRGWQIDNVVITATLPSCTFPALHGDMNGDGLVDGADVQLFTDAVTIESAMPAHVCPGDFTNDGVVTLLDVPLFVMALME